MLQFDQVPYIFGSFSRRRHSTVVEPNRNQHFISHSYSRSQPATISFKEDAECLQRPKSFDFNEVCDYVADEQEQEQCNVTLNHEDFYCKYCRKQYVEPKVLPCLHTFCTKCLNELVNTSQDQNQIQIQTDKIDGQKRTEMVNSNLICISISRPNSNCSSTETNASNRLLNERDKTRRRPKLTEHPSLNEIECPACQRTFQLPLDGIKSLPADFIVQNRILLASVNQSSIQLLCDLCTNETPATSRCNYCLINMCNICTKAHKRQRFTWQHHVLSVEEARKMGIKKIRRQIMCLNHPDFELKFFCATCCQVTCRECNKTLHRDHRCDNVSSKYAQLYTLKIRQAVDRIRPVVEQAPTSFERFHLLRTKMQSRCDAINNEIETFMDAYIRAVEQHRQLLLLQVNEIFVDKMKHVEKQQKELQTQAEDTERVIHFVDSLLQEGTDIEILTFIKPILKKLDYCKQFAKMLEPNVAESVQFLPREVASDDSDGCPLYGIITTQKVDPQQCVLHYNSNFKPLSENVFRPKRTIQLTLETRDTNSQRIAHGGEKIGTEFKYHTEPYHRHITVNIQDCKDGTYTLSFTPEFPGKLILTVTVRGQPIKDSPYVIVVKPIESHSGTYHCCTFCSSNGSKEVTCGCGSKMPGGYNGCAHGHENHPGTKHWSCCGNTLQNSDCKRITSKLYQISL